jgi:hypothetical protein
MARCECGALYVPTGEDITIAFKQGGVSTYMSLEHKKDALVIDEQKLVSYGYTQASPSITPTLISVQFAVDNLTAVGVMKLIVRKGDVKIVEKYFGVKGEEWTLPTLGGRPIITASCSDILNNIDISDSKIHVEIISVCDLSPGDCCGNTVDIVFKNIVHSICTEEKDSSQSANIVWRYTQNGDNCIQDVNGLYASYPDCYASIPQEAINTIPTTTTCNPIDPSCTTTTTTIAPVDEYNWSLQGSFVPSGDASFIGDIAMSDDGTVIALEDEYNATNPHFRVMKLNPSCVWEQLGENISGDWINVSMTANGSGVAAMSNDDHKLYAYEWNGSNWATSGTPFLVGDGTRAGASQITYNGKYVVASNTSHDSYKGILEVHEWNGSDWSMKGVANEMLGVNTDTFLSLDVCISDDGNTVLGSPSSSATNPAVIAWEWNGYNWIQKGQSIYPDVNIGELAQTDVTMMGDGSRITIGCPESNNGGLINCGSIKVYRWSTGISQWVLSQTLFGSASNARLGSDSSSTMTRDGTSLIISEKQLGVAHVLTWNGQGYFPSRIDSEVGIFDIDNAHWGVKTTISQNGLAFAATSNSSVASGVCQVVQSDNYLCDTVIPTTPPPPTTTTTTTTTLPPPSTTTTTTIAPSPPFVPHHDDLSVAGGGFSGCFVRTGAINGKYSYTRVSTGGSVFSIYYVNNGWVMRQTAPIDEIANTDPYYNYTPFNSFSPPLTGWEDISSDPAPVTIQYSNCT